MIWLARMCVKKYIKLQFGKLIMGKPNIAPSQVGHFTSSAASERKQQAMNVCWRLHGQGATVVVA